MRSTLRLLPSLLALAAGLAVAAPARAFVLLGYRFEPCTFPCTPQVDVERTLREAPRWNADPNAAVGLADGLTVAVAPGFAEALADKTPLPASAYETGLFDAFAAWETPELSFDIMLDATPTAEINLFAVDSKDHPDFAGNGFSGIAFTFRGFRTQRMLTSGEVVAGHAITGSDIYIAHDRVRQSFGLWKLAGLLEEADRLDRYINLLIHEIGHGLGLGHANENPHLNFDDDGDPFTVFEPSDPTAPWVGLSLSENVDPDAIMRGGLPLDFGKFSATALFPDDRSGLNLLYPSLPEPGRLFLLGAAALGFAGRRRHDRNGVCSPRPHEETPWPPRSTPRTPCSTPSASSSAPATGSRSPRSA